MANTPSAEKRNRQTQRRRVRNLHVRTGVKSAVKKVREAVAQGDATQAKQALHQAARAIGIINPLELEHGHICVPKGPGLGIELDRDRIENVTIEVH